MHEPCLYSESRPVFSICPLELEDELVVLKIPRVLSGIMQTLESKRFTQEPRGRRLCDCFLFCKIIIYKLIRFKILIKFSSTSLLKEIETLYQKI